MSDYLTDSKPGNSNAKVELDLKNYATKEELKYITHVDNSSFALKTNLASLKTGVHKLDIPKLSIVHIDLSDLSKEVQEDFTKKTNFNSLKTKVDKNETDNDNLETKTDNNDLTVKASIASLKTKVDDIDLTKYVLKSNYDTKIGNLELKIPDVRGLLRVSSFNSKVNELENKIKTAELKPDITNLATKSSVTTVENKIPYVDGFAKKTDYEITSIKNDYATKAILDSKVNDLKSTHIADEVKKVDGKVTKNISDILNYKTSLEHNKSLINDLEREASFNRGFCYYTQQFYFLFEPKSKSYTGNSGVIHAWISTGIHNDSDNTDLFSENNSNNHSPTLLNENNGISVEII